MFKIKSIKNLRTKFLNKNGIDFVEFFLLNDVLNVRKVDVSTNIEISRHICGCTDLKFFLCKNNLITIN